MYPKLTFRTEADGEAALTPTGWTQRFYKLNDGPIRYSKWTLELSESLFIEEPHLLEGHLRIDGRIDRGRLLIGILSKEEEYRLLSAKGSGDLVTISYDGSEWDLVAEAVGTAITLHAAPDLAEKIIGIENIPLLRNRMVSLNAKRSILLPVTQEADKLATMMRKFVRFAYEGDYFENRLDRLHFAYDMIVGQSSLVMSSILEHAPLNEKIAKERRTSIAKEIENILWDNLGNAEGVPSSVKEFADYFQVSTRTIQFAIEEVFQTTFTSFRNSIRLYQARDMLRENPHHGIVTDVAIGKGFDHQGRFANRYKMMFGVLPSHEVKSTRKRKT